MSTWFANARRRLKKENKLYPGDRDGKDDDDDDDDDDEKQRKHEQDSGSEKNFNQSSGMMMLQIKLFEHLFY